MGTSASIAALGAGRAGDGAEPRPRRASAGGEQSTPATDGERAAGPASGSTSRSSVAVDAEQHDHEQEQHDDGAGVDDDLHGGQEVGLLGDEQHGDAEQGGHQAEGGVDRVAARAIDAEGADQAR